MHTKNEKRIRIFQRISIFNTYPKVWTFWQIISLKHAWLVLCMRNKMEICTKQLPKHYAADDLLASSAREGINSFRVDSQRKSHRVGVEENRLIDLIYEK